ncbi:MAG TPA: tRNA (adenosine(37)-N6)-threonylcarbamoyltransferase complex dimerization subunit type 1 TsaB [Actinopolymorphaceae bacterium]
MLLLAFDTATSAVTVALSDGRTVLADSTTVDGQRHAELLAPAIRKVLKEAGVDRRELTEIAVGVGPGPFTGLRVGLATARTLGHALHIPVHGVCTLDVLACAADEPALAESSFLVATDARRKEVYWARYTDRYTRVDGPHVDRPDTIATDAPVVGRGARLYPSAFPRAVDPEYPSAADLAFLVAGRRVPLLPPLPLYLRRPDVAPPSPRKSVLAGRAGRT